jgi:exodeoxyribonuclease VII large subunit
MRARLAAALRGRAADARSRLDALAQHRVFRRPFDRIHDLARQVDELDLRAKRAIGYQLTRNRDRLGALAARLESLSPLGVLARGYSVTQRTASGQVVTDAAALTVGDTLTSRFGRGQAISQVTEIHPADVPT